MNRYDNNGLTEEEFLAAYDPGDYPRPSVAADIVIFTIAGKEEDNHRKLPAKELSVLLIQRGGHPYLGDWALPGGFVRPGETVGAAAGRELREETGVESGYLEQLYTFSEPGRDPRTWVMSCTHMALLGSSEIRLKAGDDASDARWFTLTYDQIGNDAGSDGGGIPVSPHYRMVLSAGGCTLSAVVEQAGSSENTQFQVIESGGLAFDHAGIIAYAIHRLRNKVEYTDLAFNLMPERFTLTELQQVYEILLGRPLLKAAFRRKIKPLVTATGEYTEPVGHRPSQLFVRCTGHQKEGTIST